MPIFKEDKLGCCVRGTTSFIARALPELTEAQIARHIRRRAAYRQKRLEKQRTQRSELQISQKWVEKERPDQVAAVHMVGKTKRRQKRMSSSSVTKTVSSFDSRRVNVLVTNFEQPPPDDNMALRIQQLEQRQE
ncbi:hypothetical protein MRB53_002303 [Persea americana]|uniref:Uncharacterized protein n=1 Tax=Persea americana TaxID=3435 RepID=A0ACC2MV25_PERAE|nr:hypothetical protein MRB53_002303 [Persea americana]